MRTTARNAEDGSDGTDSIGVAQWNSDRAARLKKFAAARGADWHDLQTQLEFVDLELRTSEGKAGSMLTNAQNVRDATAAMVMYERPRGSDRGAESADGWGNRLRHAQTFASKWGGGSPVSSPEGSVLVSVLPSDKRMEMLERAQREVEIERNRKDYASRQETQAVRNLMADDINSVTSTGKPVETLTQDRIAAIMGEEAARQHMRERAAAQQYFDTTSAFPNMTTDQIKEKVESLKPVGGQEGFTEKQAAQEKIAKEASRVIKQRDEDPAAAVDNDPALAPLKQKAYADTSDAKAWRELGKARMASQRALGIPETTVSPITMAEAKRLMDPLLEAGPGQELATLRQLAQQFDQLFGDQAQRAFIMGLVAANVDKATAAQAAPLLRKLGLGSSLSGFDARTLDMAATQNQAGRVFAPLSSDPSDVVYDAATGVPIYNPANNAAPAWPVRTGSIPEGARRMLIGDPKLAEQFDAKYGAGAAKRILETAGISMPAPKKAAK